MPSVNSDVNADRVPSNEVGKNLLLGPTALLLSRLLILSIGPVISLWVVRYLGPYQYGLYASASAVTSLLSILCDFGLQQATLKLASEPRADLPSVIRGAIRVGWVFSAVAFVGVVTWVTAIPNYKPIVVTMAVIGATAFPATPLRSLITAGLQVRAEYARIAWWNLVSSMVQWGSVVLAILLRLDVIALVAAPIIATWLTTVGLWVIEGTRLQLHGGRIRAVPPLRAIVKEAWLFGVGSVMYQTYHRSALAILSATRTPVEVGHYSVAFRIVELTYLFPSVVFNEVLFPRYFAWRLAQRKRLELYYRMMTKAMVYAGLFAAGGLGLLGSDAMRLIFGTDQPQAVRLLSIMAWGIPARYWASSPGAVLLTDGHLALRIRNQAIAAMANVAANLLLTPGQGATASAVIMVATEVVMLVLHTFGLRSATEIELRLDKKTVAGVGAAVLLSGGLRVVAASIPPTSRILLAVALGLGISSFALLTVYPDELSELRKLAGRPAQAVGRE